MILKEIIELYKVLIEMIDFLTSPLKLLKYIYFMVNMLINIVMSYYLYSFCYDYKFIGFDASAIFKEFIVNMEFLKPLLCFVGILVFFEIIIFGLFRNFLIYKVSNLIKVNFILEQTKQRMFLKTNKWFLNHLNNEGILESESDKIKKIIDDLMTNPINHNNNIMDNGVLFIVFLVKIIMIIFTVSSMNFMYFSGILFIILLILLSLLTLSVNRNTYKEHLQSIKSELNNDNNTNS